MRAIEIEKISYTPQPAKILVKFIDQTGAELTSEELYWGNR